MPYSNGKAALPQGMAFEPHDSGKKSIPEGMLFAHMLFAKIQGGKKLRLLHDLLLKCIENRRIEKSTETDIETVAQLFDRDNGNIMTCIIQHTVNCGWCYTGTCCQFIRFDIPLITDF